MMAPACGACAASPTVLYSFTQPPNGVRPRAPVIGDAAGNLYGTTYTGAKNGAGTVYELSPPANGQVNWKERVLHHFGPQARGHYPQSALTLDKDGNLYGVTPNGSKSDAGLVFMLVKPSAGDKDWTQKILYHFDGGKEGGTPYGALVFDADGNLYGTTGYGGAHGAGIVFRLSPDASKESGWKKTTLYSFSNGADGGYPYCTLAFDAAGNLYGTTLNGGNAGNGVVFELSPPANGGTWTEQVLHSFDDASDGVLPRTGVVLDGSGNLYGTTENGGTSNWGVVFEVSPPANRAAGWSEMVLHSFDFTDDGGNPGYSLPVLDKKGKLYGTTQVGGSAHHGTAFVLSPPAGGGSAWTEKTLTPFTAASGPAEPEAGFAAVPGGKLIGTTFAGGDDANGTVYEIAP